MSIRFLILFFWVMSINLSLFSVKLNLSNTVLALFILYSILLNKKIDRSSYTIIIFIFICLLYTTLVFLFNNTYSMYLLNIFVLAFLYATSFAFLFNLYASSGDKITLHFVYIVTFNSMLILISAYDIQSIAFIYDFIAITDKQFKYSFGEANIRRYSGLNTAGFSFLSTLNFFAVFFTLHMFSTKSKNSDRKRLVVFIIINFLATIWIGRTGLFLIIFYISAYLFIASFYRTLFGFAIIGIVFTLLGAAYLDGISFDNLSHIVKVFSGESETYSLVKNEYRLYLHTFSDFLFGATITSDSSTSLPSDVGLINILNLFGIFGVLLFFSNYFFFLVTKPVNRREAFLLYTFPVLALVLNMKDTYLLSYTPLFKAFILLVAVKKYEHKKS